MKAIATDKAPRPIGPYSQAVLSGNMVFCSGQIGADPQSGELASGGIGAETSRAMENIVALLSAAGTDLSKAVRMDVFLADMDDYQKFNEVYSGYFNGGAAPARFAVGAAKLPRNARVEIGCIATLE